MILDKYVLAAVFRFDPSHALKGMKRAYSGFMKFKKSIAPVGRAFMKFAKVGVAAATAIGGTTAYALGRAINTASDFEQQMATVAAVLGKPASQIKELSELALEMGATTVFTARESGKAIELMARAGFKTTEIMQGLRGVLNMAAAEGMDLATATDITASIVRAFGLEASKTSKVADVLAQASRSANTTIVGLGEAFRYSAPAMAQMGFSVEETAAALSVLADAGLKGSIAGTSLTAAMVHLTKPSEKASKLMREWGIRLTDASGKMLPFADIVKQLETRINDIGDASERGRILTELFGVRGARAMGILFKRGSKDLKGFVSSLRSASGTAMQMAQERLNNFRGAMTLLRSAIESLSIRIGSLFLGSLKSAVQGLTGFVSQVGQALGQLAQGKAVVTGVSGSALMVARALMGLYLKIKTLMDAFREVFPTIKATILPAFQTLLKSLGVLGAGEGAQHIQSIKNFLIGMANVIAIVVKAVSGLIWVLKKLWTIFKGIGKALGSFIGAMVYGVPILKGKLATWFKLKQAPEVRPRPAPTLAPVPPSPAEVRERATAGREALQTAVAPARENIQIVNRVSLDGKEISHSVKRRDIKREELSGKRFAPKERLVLVTP